MLEKIDLKIVAKKNAVVPAYKTEGSAGADVCARCNLPLGQAGIHDRPYPYRPCPLHRDGNRLEPAGQGR